jgi:hypothetical protein
MGADRMGKDQNRVGGGGVQVECQAQARIEGQLELGADLGRAECQGGNEL